MANSSPRDSGHRRALSTFVLSLMAAAAAATCSSCAGGESEEIGEWQSETVTAGNVTTVRTLSGSVWGGTAQLREEASIGVEAGDDVYMLGQLRSVWATRDEIYVLDQQVPAIRVYDLAGRHLRDLGQEGDGPGEFRRPESLAIGPDGRIYVRDGRAGRITIFSPEGEELGTMRLTAGFQTSTQLVITADGTLYNSQRTNPGGDVSEWGMAMVPRYEDEEREGEPIFPPDFDFESWTIESRREGSVSINGVPFAPGVVWTLSPSGAIIGGLSTDYSFDIRYPDGRVTRVEKSWEPIPVDPAEGRWYKRRATANMLGMNPDWVWNGPDVPDQKPAFSMFIADHSGRIWIMRLGRGQHAEGECNENPSPADDYWADPCWSEPTTWEVFDEEGRFLGKADIPAGVQTSPRPYIRDELFVTSFQDEMGTVMVKRYRIATPGN